MVNEYTKSIEYIIGVHITIPDDVTDQISKACVEAEVPGYWGNHKIDPHITLHLSAFPQENFDACVQALTQSTHSPFIIELDDVHIEGNPKRENFFVSLGIKKNEALIDLHKDVVKTVNQYRNGLIRAKDILRIENNKYTPEEIKMIQQYGYLRVLQNFNQHITLGEISTNEDTERITQALTEKLESIQHQSFTVASYIVGLYAYDLAQAQYITHSDVREKEIFLNT